MQTLLLPPPLRTGQQVRAITMIPLRVLFIDTISNLLYDWFILVYGVFICSLRFQRRRRNASILFLTNAAISPDEHLRLLDATRHSRQSLLWRQRLSPRRVAMGMGGGDGRGGAMDAGIRRTRLSVLVQQCYGSISVPGSICSIVA